MKKRLISAAVAFVMVFNLVLIPDSAAVFNSGAVVSSDWEYIVNADGTASITRYRGTGVSVTVPSSLDGKKVTGLGDSSFNGFGSVFGGSLKSLKIPNSVTNIGREALRKCTGLESVTIGNGVTSIGHSAFYNCSSLTSVTIVTEAKMSLY